MTFDPATNELTFIPMVDNDGDAVVPFTVTDNNGGTITPTVTFQPVNPGPEALDQSVTTDFETPVGIDPLSNDTDPDGDPLMVTEINGVAVTPGVAQLIAVPGGTVTVDTDGTVTVTPDDGFSGDIDVPYTIEDQDGATSSATHSVVVANAPPQVIDPSPAPGSPSIDPSDSENIIVPAVDGQPVTIDLDDYLTDANGDPLTITVGTLPPGATFDPATNQFTFVPDPDNDGNTVLPFTVTDNNGATSTPTLTIEPVNPAPVAVDETVTTSFETPVIIDLLTNDTDPDGDPLTVAEINGVPLTPGVEQTIPVSDGTVVVSAAGVITVTPDNGFSGNLNVPYLLSDQDGATDSAVHTVEVETAPPVIPDPTPGEWSITGTREIVEDSDPQYTIALSGSYDEGAIISVDVGLAHIESEAADFGDIQAAFQSAADANPDVTFTPLADSQATAAQDGVFQDDSAPGSIGTVTFTSPEDGASMSDLIVDIPLFDDLIIENPEDFLVDLFNSSFPDGTTGGIDPNSDQVVTTIQDNDFFVGLEPSIGNALPPVTNYVPVEYESLNVLQQNSAGLNRLTVTLSELVVNEAVNQVSSLDSAFGGSLLSSIGQDELNGAAFQDEPGIHTRYIVGDGGSVGFSSGKGYAGTISTDVTDECGRFYIDTIVQGESLAINAHSTIDPEYSSPVVAYTATLANGDPLPSFISEISDGEYIVQRTPDVEVIRLRIAALRESGYELVREVEINTSTGVIVDLPLVDESESTVQASAE